jgi:hypothetical protein
MARPLAAFVVALLGAGTASAHHSRVNFLNETVAFDGEIVRFDWANPHSHIYVAGRDSSGRAVEWEIESSSTPVLTRRGWTADSLQAGERVTVRAQPYRDRTRNFVLLQTITKADGTALASGAGPAAAAPPPRANDLFGVWQTFGARGGGQGIAPGAPDQPATTLPLTPKARAAAARFSMRDNPLNECVAPTTPESIGVPYLHAIERDGEHILLRDEYWEVTRRVHMDGRAHPPLDERTPQGHSIGRWEGDTLVVETTNFADNVWGTARGIPSGRGKRVVERYSLADDGATMAIEFAIEDPEYLTAAVMGGDRWRYAPDLELLPNKCDLEVAHRYLDGQ